MRNLSIWARSSAAAAALAVTGLCGAAYAQAPDISGTYWATEYRPKIQLVGGGELPLTAAGKAAYEKNMAGLKDGSITDTARKFCVPDGLPRVLATPYPFEIIQAPPGQITVVHELNHQIRVVAMDKPMPSDKELIPFPYYNGHSVGHFEGDTLVVDSAGFNEKTFVDATGAPHTDEMRTTERIRKISPTQLEDVITIHDPEYYTTGLAGALRLHAAQRRAARRLCLRRTPSRPVLGGGRAPAIAQNAVPRRAPTRAGGACDRLLPATFCFQCRGPSGGTRTRPIQSEEKARCPNSL